MRGTNKYSPDYCHFHVNTAISNLESLRLLPFKVEREIGIGIGLSLNIGRFIMTTRFPGYYIKLFPPLLYMNDVADDMCCLSVSACVCISSKTFWTCPILGKNTETLNWKK